MISKDEVIEIADSLGYTIRDYGPYIEVHYKPDSSMWDSDFIDPSSVLAADYTESDLKQPILFHLYKLIKQTENGYKMVGESVMDCELPKECVYNILKDVYKKIKDAEQQYNLDLIKGDFDD